MQREFLSQRSPSCCASKLNQLSEVRDDCNCNAIVISAALEALCERLEVGHEKTLKRL